jgi:mRNA interferase MazF
MVKTKYIPDRQDIVWLEFDPQKGRETKKTRPALIISPREYNAKVGLALCIPITSKIKNYPFEVIIEGKKITGAILADQIRSHNWQERKAEFIMKCYENTFSEVIEKIKALILIN